ncbi:MAG: PTS mannitol transporter subunit IICBA [Actinomycetales bacterium]|nr:PTS mannitol transporter subunit IICBA [Actinomycetales bacterium]
MVMPNIGAFIAWGLITALFIKSGWLNMGGSGGLADDSWVAQIGGWGKFDGKGIVGPMITYLLPILIGYTGGKMVYETRGGVVGAIATMGVISGTSIPMFMGAMVMGPLGGWTMKKIDSIWDGKIKPGFEMLVNNFSAGIWGLILACAGFFIVGPKLIMPFADVAGNVVKTLVNNGLLPLTSVFIEPAKILFLNNAINHGVLTPLGTNQSLTDGKSILFLLEANPGPGLGLLLAFMVAGKGMARASAPGAALIHFVGGIHEIYFPYVLAKPRLIAAMILGGMTGVFTNVLFGSGLRAPAAPGSILAVLAQTPGPSLVGVILSVVLSATVTFLVAAFLLRMDKSDDAGDLSAATASMEAMKGKKSVASAALTGAAAGGAALTGPVRSIVFACDAGMGSSAMGASVLRRKIQDAGITGVTVVNKAISNLTDDVDLLVTHQDLATRAAQRTPSAALYTVDNFMASPTYDQIVADLQVSNAPSDASPTSAPAAAATAVAAPAAAVATAAAGQATDGILTEDLVRLSGRASSRDDAIREVGAMLVGSGAVDASYVDSMLERERSVSTYMGNQLAIPHGTNEAKAAIHRTAMAFIRYPNGIDWNGKPATFVIGIAGAGDDHLTLLSGVAKVFLDKGQIAALTDATTPQQVLAILNR